MKILCHNTELRAFIERLPQAFAQGEGEVLYDKRNQIRKFQLGNGQVIIVKRYKRPNAFQRLCYSTFWQNKAEKAYHFADRLLQLGIETPAPLGALTLTNRFGLVEQYYFASSEDTNQECMILAKEPQLQDREALGDALGAFLVKIHQKGFLHGDTNLANILYRKEDDGYHFSVIDTNRSTFLDRPASHQECINNLSRLSHHRDLLSFLAAAYAKHAGWDVRQTQEEIEQSVTRFEKKRAMRRLFKRKK